MASSESIKKNIQAAYKVVRKDNDLNIPLSVQAWGIDGEKRRYYLIEGLNDTQFRIYRESNYTGINRGWRDVAGSIEEARALAARLMEVDGGPKAKEMKRKIESVIPRFEESAEVSLPTSLRSCYLQASCLMSQWSLTLSRVEDGFCVLFGCFSGV